ncbi:spore germination lipoprotein GerD [Gracilibacillus alcaliphilus]|uniref:spore germination lipoprotein GerD n=1 Tax=Gracilibacillus alcaliphilus TaxID=1401441 RepID=UPI00195752C6|nr:spore germination protein D [Gracilibacillus alcaliphilus]
MYRFIYIVLLGLCLLTGCNNTQSEAKENTDYENTKKMVADILKTDDGKRAITEVLASDDMQQTYVIDTGVVKQAVTESLSSDQGKEFWTKMFQDPTFVEPFATTLQDQQTEVSKKLMSDPEYQKKMMEILSDPEMEKQTLTLLTSQQFREHLGTVIEETINSPMFQAKIAEMLSNSGGGGNQSSPAPGNDKGVAGKEEENQ